MTNHQDGNLCKGLRNMKDDMKWKEEHQRALRERLYTTISNYSASQKRFSRKIMPTLLTCMLLMVFATYGFLLSKEEFLTSEHSGENMSVAENQKKKTNLTVPEGFVNLELSLDDELIITDMKQNGILVGLPKFVPAEANRMLFIYEKVTHDNRYLVHSKYGNENDVEEGTWVLSIMQEELLEMDTRGDARYHVEKVIAKNAVLQHTMYRGNDIYVEKPRNNTGLTSAWLITDDSFYVISSPTISSNDLVEVAKGITNGL